MSWVVQILPQLDQPGTYSHFNFSVSVYDSENLAAARCYVSSFVCPSSPWGGVAAGTGSAANYGGCHHDVEAPIDVDNHGVLYLNSSVRYRDIRDGTATTIFVGEHSGDTMGWASGTRASLRNTGGPINGGQTSTGMMAAPPIGTVSDGFLLAVGGFSSSHTGGANFLLGDGSVRFISQVIPQDVFRCLAHRADGNLPGEF
jgi:prepilin-type processing-associated H-X9-DG protein